MADTLILDVGGTGVKYGLAGPEGLLPETVRQRPSRSDGSREEILAVFAAIAEEGRQANVRRACIAIAGPFDFEHGVSLMRHKFAAIYGASLRDVFRERGLETLFLHDSTAYMLGESAGGVLKDVRNACCVMLGTGLGFAVMRDRRIWLSEDRSPALALWRQPWKGATAEDAVSTRAIQRRYGAAIPVRDIADRAREGDAAALTAFRDTGAALAEMAGRLTEIFPCERFALGGQIALSADLLALPEDIPWAVCAQPDRTALIGACEYAARGEACIAIQSADTVRALEREVQRS